VGVRALDDLLLGGDRVGNAGQQSLPNSFERATRTRLPPMLTFTISRRV
jgi:hypothetical protein